MPQVPDSTLRWRWEPPGQDDIPPAARVRAVCRALTMRQWLAFRNRRAEAVAEGLSDLQVVETLLDAVRLIVERWENTPPGAGAGPDAIMDLATPGQLWEWTDHLGREAQLVGVARGKSEPPPHGGGGESAGAARGVAIV